MTKAPTLLIVALLALGALAATPHAQADIAGEVRFVDLARQPLPAGSSTDDDNIPELVGTGAVGMVHLKDSDLSQLDETTVKVYSSSDSTGETITLYNSGPNSPDFFGTFGIEGTAVANNGLVQVAHNGQLFISYADISPGGPPINSAPGSLEWLTGADGAISMPGDLLGSSSATVTVTDSDANRLPAEKDSFQGRAFSRTDVTGVTLDFLETGVNTGDFTASIPLQHRTGSDDAAGKVDVVEGDLVTALFTDTDVRGRQVERQATGVWHETHSGAVAFTSKDTLQRVDFVGGVGDKLATLRVEDPDLVGVSSVTVRIVSSADAIGMDLTLEKTGASTGEFVGQLGFTEGQTGAGRIRVANGGTVTARYTDARTATGGSQTASDTATWFPGPTLRFMDANFASEVTSQSAASNPHLQVVAPSYNKDPSAADFLPVHITSAATGANRDPLGIIVRLKETGPATGIFQDAEAGKAFTFSTTAGGDGSKNETAPGTGSFLVRDKDVVVATFEDTRGSGLTAQKSLTINGGAPTAPSGKGTLQLMQCTANCNSQNPTLGAVPAGGLVGLTSNHIFVKLDDPAFNTANTSPQTVDVRIGSVAGNPIAWSTDGQDLVGGLVLRLTETSDDSRIFVGKFGTTEGATSTNPCVPSATNACLLKVAPTDTIGVAYAYVDQPGNRRAQDGVVPPATCSDGSSPGLGGTCTAQDHVGKGVAWHALPYTTPANAVVSFRTALHEGAHTDTFTGLGQGFITVTGIDRFEDTSAAANTIKAHVRSTSDADGIDVVLTERYGRSNGNLSLTPDDVFAGQFSFTSDASSGSTGKLKVASGDILEVSYTDLRSRTGASNVAVYDPDETEWIAGATGVLTVPSSIRMGTAGTIQLADADRNVNNTADKARVWIVPEAEPAFPLDLTETTGTSGIFTGDLDIETTCQGGSDVDACVVSGDRVVVRYDDESAVTGSPATVQSSFVGLAPRGGLLVLSQPSYATTGATGVVELRDPDLAVSDSIAESVRVRMFSDSDGEGEELVLTETGANTKVFRATFGFESNRVEGNNKTRVNTGDRVTIYYLDANTVDTTTTLENVPVLATATWTSTATSPPTVSLAVAPATGSAPLQVTFTLTATDPDGTLASYTLNFGDGTTPLSGSGSPPSTTTHTYAADGTYTAKLTVTDNGALTGEATAVITVGTPGPPRITGVNPSQGLPTGGTVVTITGANFTSGASVTFGGANATAVTVSSPTTLTATTPAHALGTVDVVVTIGSQSVTRTGGFTYTQTPVTTTSSSSSSSSQSSTTGSTIGPGGAPTPAQILAANQRLQQTLKVTHEEGRNIVEFDVPTTGLPATVLGVQVWRSNSPYALVATLPSNDPAFTEGRYVDSGAEARETTKYLVTMYYGPTAALGQFTQANAPDTAQYPGISSVDSANDGDGGSSLPAWAIVLIVVGILFLVVLVAILIARGRNRDAQGAAAQGYAWQETTEAEAAKDEWQPPAEVHQARCPSCGTSFTAAGTKPIVTVCPGCGKKGILR